MKKEALEKLRLDCGQCCACELYGTRHNVVFSDGNPDTAKIMLIGEAPGENEDIEGKPFVGRAGKLLDKYLANAGISRKNDLYITNMIKCRPPENRKPKRDEKESCNRILLSQIDIINPKIILLCGTTAMENFINEDKITKIHGKIFDINILNRIYKAMPILHPSPLCRFPDKENVMIQDLLLVKNLI